mmetsp:Transcript_21545/g.53423  ORF Transcript_21545/g.53423 Transcript_21545/m.53423 type:complete len:454 (-) Transcript_21545:91-1452(-)
MCSVDRDHPLYLVDSFGNIHLVLVNLFQWLALSDNVWLALEIDHNLGSLGEGVVVFGAHSRAVGTASVHDQEISDFGLSQCSLGEVLGLSGLGCHQITTLAAVTNDNDVFRFGSNILRLSSSGKNGHGVDGSVERWTKHIGHSRIEFQKGVASLPGGEDLVLDGRYQSTAHGNKVGSGFDFQSQFTSVFFGKLTEGVSDGSTNALQISRYLSLDTSDLVSSTKIQSFDGIPDLAEGKGFGGDLLPDRGVASGSNVCVDSFNGKSVFGNNVWDGSVVKKGIPDSKRRGRSSDVRLGKSARRRRKTTRTGSGVDANANLLSSSLKGLSDAFHLRHGAGVDLDSHLDEIGKVVGKLLRTETDVFRRDSGVHGALDLESRRRINVDALGGKELQDGRVGTGLHGVSDGQAVGVGKGQAGVGGFVELIERVGKDGTSGEVCAGLGGFGSQKDGGIRRC